MGTDPSRVAMSGPLTPFATGFAAELAGRGQVPGVVAVHLRLMAHLSRWLEAQALGPADLELGAVGAFVAARRAAGCSSGRTAGSLAPLLGYPRRRSCRPPPPPAAGPGPASSPAGRHAGHGSRTRWPTEAPPGLRSALARPEQCLGRGTGGNTIQYYPDRLLIWRPAPADQRVRRSAQPGQVRLAGKPDPLPDRSEPVIPGSGERADRDRDQAGQWVDPPVRGARVGRRFQPLPHSRGQILAAGTGLDDARTHARQCHSGHAS
jgi:hypothetical protein